MVGPPAREPRPRQRVVHVRRQAVQTNAGAILLTDPKSDAGKRRVVVPPFLVPEIRAHLDRYVGAGEGRLGVRRAQGSAADPEQLSHDLVKSTGRGGHPGAASP